MIHINKIFNKSVFLITGLLLLSGLFGFGISNVRSLNAAGEVIPKKIAVTVGEDETKVGISFETALGVNEAKVVISLNENLTNPVEFAATSKTLSGTRATSSNIDYLSWGAFVTGLVPDTRYYYKVGNDQGWSSINSFKTLKATGDATILFYGDIQGGYANLPNVFSEAFKKHPEVDLSILAGDIMDSKLKVYDEMSALDTYNKTYFNNYIWASALGNHDTYDDGNVFTGYFYGPNNGVDNGSGARNYYFEYNDAVFFNLDTEAGFASYDPGYTKQITLLRQVMTETTKKYKIVIMHRSAYPMNYDEASVRALSGVFEELGVDLVLSGHDHVYHRTTMFENNKTVINEGVTYVVGGSASGSKYYDAKPNRPWEGIVYDNNNPVFMSVRFSNGNIAFRAYAIEPTRTVTIDTFTISKFDIDLTKTEGIELKGSLYARAGDSITYTVDTLEGYLFDYVKVDGQFVELVNNQFTVSNISRTTKIEIQAIKINKPIALEVNIVGSLITGKTLTADYTYLDPKLNPEQNSIISWYVDGLKVYEGHEFLIENTHFNKQIEVRVTAVSDSETGFERAFISTEKVKLLGDLNGDASVTTSDALMLLQAITGRITLTEEQVLLADINGTPTLKDVRNILVLMEGK